MNPEEPKWLEVIDTVFLGIDCAVPLAAIAFVVHKLGWYGFPVVALPLFCAYSVGRKFATDKWMKNMDTKMAALNEEALRPNRDAIYKHDLHALLTDGANDGCHTDVGTALRKRLARLQVEADKVGRPAGCLCHWEQGDSPCPVHGEDEGM